MKSILNIIREEFELNKNDLVKTEIEDFVFSLETELPEMENISTDILDQLVKQFQSEL